jgi:hypothetical protein|tara:strand:- start:267 stop:428 length:162 start_codon:yes stop_codon:yes gene_type:complete
MNIYLCEVFIQVDAFNSEIERTFITARSEDRAREATGIAFPEGAVTVTELSQA